MSTILTSLTESPWRRLRPCCVVTSRKPLTLRRLNPSSNARAPRTIQMIGPLNMRLKSMVVTGYPPPPCGWLVFAAGGTVRNGPWRDPNESFVDVGSEHGDAPQVAVALREVEAVADHE